MSFVDTHAHPKASCCLMTGFGKPKTSPMGSSHHVLIAKNTGERTLLISKGQKKRLPY